MGAFSSAASQDGESRDAEPGAPDEALAEIVRESPEAVLPREEPPVQQPWWQ